QRSSRLSTQRNSPATLHTGSMHTPMKLPRSLMAMSTVRSQSTSLSQLSSGCQPTPGMHWTSSVAMAVGSLGLAATQSTSPTEGHCPQLAGLHMAAESHSSRGIQREPSGAHSSRHGPLQRRLAGSQTLQVPSRLSQRSGVAQVSRSSQLFRSSPQVSRY